jgi:hypothetical protein
MIRALSVGCVSFLRAFCEESDATAPNVEG